MVVRLAGVSEVGAQIYHFVTGTLDKDDIIGCNPTCPYRQYIGLGDQFPFSVVE